VVSEAERPLLVDLERRGDSLRGFIGDVKMMPGEKYCELIAEARIDDATLMRRCLNAKGNKSGSGGGLPIDLPDLRLIRRRK
jgi:hypothetical protein